MIYDPLLKLIKENSNWKELLKAEPRFIRIQQCTYKNNDGNLLYPELYMLSYNGISSDFNDEIVRLCRGCILSLEDPDDPVMICEPFTKFGNYGELYCPEIDWNSALVMDKVDGILIKFFNYKGKWIWVTNNGWDTSVPVKDIAQLPSKYKEPETEKKNSVQDLIDYSVERIGLNFTIKNDLNPNYTYMFELLSPKLRILVDNKKTELIYLGSRNNITTVETSLEEAYKINPDLKKFKTVEYFNLKSMDEVLALCNSYKDATKEGVVIRDKYFNRVKIKCEEYIRLKGYRRALTTSDDEIFKGIFEESIDDAIGVFPELSEKVEEIRNNINNYRKKLIQIGENGKQTYLDMLNDNDENEKEARKNYASWVLKQNPIFKSVYFECLKNTPDYNQIIEKMKYKDLIKILYNLN